MQRDNILRQFYLSVGHLFHISTMQGQGVTVVDEAHLSPCAKTISFVRRGKPATSWLNVTWGTLAEKNSQSIALH